MNRNSARLLAQNPQILKRLAKYMAQQCFRNTVLENVHAGITPYSEAGDYSDVVVKTPAGTIPRSKLSRLNDQEMKTLMIDVVNQTYLLLRTLFDAPYKLRRRQLSEGGTQPWNTWLPSFRAGKLRRDQTRPSIEQTASSIMSTLRQVLATSKSDRQGARPSTLLLRPAMCAACTIGIHRRLVYPSRHGPKDVLGVD